MLRREYLNQTFQILPDLNSDYNDTVHDEAFESSQRQIFSLQGSELTDDENLEENNYSSKNLLNIILKKINYLFIIQAIHYISILCLFILTSMR